MLAKNADLFLYTYMGNLLVLTENGNLLAHRYHHKSTTHRLQWHFSCTHTHIRAGHIYMYKEISKWTIKSFKNWPIKWSDFLSRLIGNESINKSFFHTTHPTNRSHISLILQLPVYQLWRISVSTVCTFIVWKSQTYLQCFCFYSSFDIWLTNSWFFAHK